VEENLWKILTFETNPTSKPVDEFIHKQQPQAKAKIMHTIKLLRQYGNRLGMPHAKILGSGLYELRIRGKEELRIFYCIIQAKIIYLLHAIKKQTQKTPNKDIEIAKRRMDSLTKI